MSPTATPQTSVLFPMTPLLNSEPNKQGVAEGLTIVLTYFRVYGVRSLKIGRIIRDLGLRDSHSLRTRLGWALGRLVRQRYLARRNNGRRATFVPTHALLVFLEEHPCLSGCYTGLNTCNLYGTERCPFGQRARR